MALRVGELYGELTLRADQFNRGVDTAQGRFEGLGRVVSSGTKIIGSAFTAVVAGASAMGAAVFKVGADYNILQQSSRAALTALLGSAEAANAQMDKLDAFAKQSPFAKQVFITAQQQLLGFGVAADKVLPTLDAIQNAVAATGQGGAAITGLTTVFAKVSSSAKITAEDLNQFGTYGVDAATMIGSQMGKTGAEIRDAISKGTIGAGDALDALTKGMMERFGGATANIKEQFVGAVDRIKGAWRDIGSIIAKPFIDPKGGGQAVVWANQVADLLRALEQKVGPLVDVVGVRLAGAFGKVTPAIKEAQSLINGWDLREVNGQIDTLIKYAPQIASVATGLLAVGGNALGLERLGLSLNPVVAGIAALVLASPELREVGTTALEGLEPLIPVLQLLVSELANVSSQVIGELAPSLVELVQAIAPAIVVLAHGLTPALVSTVEAAEPIAEVLADILTWVAKLPGPVLIGAAAFAGMAAVLPGLVSSLRGLPATIKDIGIALKTTFIGNPVTLAIAAIATAVGIFAARQAAAQQKVDDFAQSLDQATGAITDNTRALVYNNLEKSGAIEQAKKLGVSLSDLVDASINPAGAAFERLSEQTEAARQAQRDLAGDQVNIFAKGLGAATETASAYGDIMAEVKGQSKGVAEAQQQVADQIAAGIGVEQEATGATNEHTDALKELQEAQRAALDGNISLREAQIRETEARNEANQVAAEGADVTRDATGAVDANAEATINADKALLNLVSSNVAVTDAMAKNGAKASELNSIIGTQRQQFIDAATQMGYNQTEAEKLADAYGLIPNKVATDVELHAEQAQRDLEAWLAAAHNRSVTIQVRATMPDLNGPASGSGRPGLANGGIVDYYARGGVRSEQHIAQIAPAGAYRVWAENETGGEGYIPLALSKRARSLQIMDQIANRFGYQMVPKDGATGSTTTSTVNNKHSLTYIAAPGPSMSAEEQLYQALGVAGGGW